MIITSSVLEDACQAFRPDYNELDEVACSELRIRMRLALAAANRSSMIAALTTSGEGGLTDETLVR
jgi:hypothetical protein